VKSHPKSRQAARNLADAPIFQGWKSFPLDWRGVWHNYLPINAGETLSNDDLHPEDLKRRDYLVKLLSVAALSMTPAGVVYPAWWSTPAKKLDSERSIYQMEGRVNVNGRKADLDTRISAGDTVSTDRDGEVIFVVGSDSFIMRTNSEMEIEGEGFFVNTLRMISGGVLSVFGQRRASQESIRMLSSTATLGIRGTGVYMEVEPDLTYLCTCYGQVALASAQDPNDSVILTAEYHDVPKYITNKASNGSRIREAPVKNHSDVELKLLEKIVGRDVPEGFETVERKKSYDK
jgi:hypothetical protein